MAQQTGAYGADKNVPNHHDNFLELLKKSRQIFCCRKIQSLRELSNIMQQPGQGDFQYCLIHQFSPASSFIPCLSLRPFSFHFHFVG